MLLSHSPRVGFYHFKDIGSCLLQGQEPPALENCWLVIRGGRASLGSEEARVGCLSSAPGVGIRVKGVMVTLAWCRDKEVWAKGMQRWGRIPHVCSWGHLCLLPHPACVLQRLVTAVGCLPAPRVCHTHKAFVLKPSHLPRDPLRVWV